VSNAVTPETLVDPTIATLERYDTEAEWLAARRRGIGASEAAAVLGLSKFLSPMDVWSDKVGLAEPRAELERMKWGKRLQRPIAEGYAEETRRTLIDPGPYTLLRSVRYPWLVASPDYLLAPTTDRPGRGTLDVKNSSVFMRQDWADEPPLVYQIQVQQQLLVTGLTWGVLAALLGGQELVYTDLAVHDGARAWLLEDLDRFWRLVQAETPPAILDGSAQTTAALRALFPKPEPGQTVVLPPEALEWDRVIQEGEASIDALEGAVNAAKNQLRAAIGAAEAGVLAGGVLWTHKHQTRKGYTKVVEPWEGRILRRSLPKGG
jgi:putative phage-type endonuclease